MITHTNYRRAAAATWPSWPTRGFEVVERKAQSSRPSPAEALLDSELGEAPGSDGGAERRAR